MDTIKTTIYNALSALSGVSVSQGDQVVFNTLPAVTFNISNNINNLGLDNTILSQDAEIKVDIWGSSSTEASSTLALTEGVLRGIGYTLSYTQDVPNPDAGIFHITTRFRTTIV